MGIPKFYKSLQQQSQEAKNPIVSEQKPNVEIDCLFFDFNNSIYQTFNTAQLEPYNPKHKDQWEDKLIQAIIAYYHGICKVVNPQRCYIAIDGVVPMAKMVQQRRRRFGKKVDESKWDTNAITPGTEFMNKLNDALHNMATEKGIPCTVNDSNIPGEGEHKIMKVLRDNKSSYKDKNHVIYGMDADLIILSLLHLKHVDSKGNYFLFRQKQDDANKAIPGQYEWFNVRILNNILIFRGCHIEDFCFIMSLMGNDFVPHSMSLVFSNKQFFDHGEWLIDMISSPGGLGIASDPKRYLPRVYEILRDGTGDQKRRELEVDRLINQLNYIQRGEDEDSKGPPNETIKTGHVQYYISQLVNDRRINEDVYYKYAHGGMSNYGMIDNILPDIRLPVDHVNKVCNEYSKALMWVWSYYKGDPVDYNWYYPYFLPPLWKDLATYRHIDHNVGQDKITPNNVYPIEQLVLVLPLSSWNLVPTTYKKQKNGKTIIVPTEERLFPIMAPHYFINSNIGFNIVGHKHDYECEALIPNPTFLDLKRIMNSSLKDYIKQFIKKC